MADVKQAGHALVPVREQMVEFYGDDILAAQVADGTVWVPLRPICDHLGLSWSGQRERTNRDPVLSEEMAVVRVTRTTATGGVPDMLALPLKYLPGWLFGVQAARVKPELQAKIIRYQRECYDVLWNAFKADILPTSVAPPTDMSQAEVAVETARALLRLAEQQLAFERELQEHNQAILQLADRQSTMANYMRGFIENTRERLTSLELQLSAGATITPAQAAEVQLAVKNVGSKLAAKDGVSGYQQVYGELYRRYGISSYKSLPAAQYDEVVAWLRDWSHE